MNLVDQPITVADEVWIATALLHRENPSRQDFEIGEIVERAHRENLHGSLRPGVRVYATMHAVANRPPNPGRHAMLFATGKHTRRLYRPGDPRHPERTGKTHPEPGKIPGKYHYLLKWWEQEYAKPGAGDTTQGDPVLALAGAGRRIRLEHEHPDAYVDELRRGWQ